MERVIEINSTLIDLGNIKSVENECYPMSQSGGHVIITLLKGREFVYNPKTKESVLIEPKIKLFADSYAKSDDWIIEIKEKWNTYLNELEKLKIKINAT